MDTSSGSNEIVLLTGSSGFLGKRILTFLLQDPKVSEIRALDISPANNKNHEITKYEKIVNFHTCDLLDVESCRRAFKGANVVIHCAAYVNYDYPADCEKLRKNNIEATKNVINLCVEENVKNLIHCSTTEVTLQPCFKGGIIAISVYKQESKLEIPRDGSRLIFGEYAATKLRAEKIVIKADGKLLKNGDKLRTVALRPTILYGEDDPHLLPKILEIVKNRGGSLPRLGSGGKQQMTYVGNAAWAFIRAKDTLRDKPEAIAGLPITVTDDTLVQDLTRFCERITRSSENHNITILNWSIPVTISYFGAYIIEILSSMGFISRLRIPPRSIVAYSGSIIIYNRSRASIHMDYWPKYKHEEAFALSAKYYGQLVNI